MRSSDNALRLAIEPAVEVTLERIARDGARRALQQAIEDEVAEYIEGRRQFVDEKNRRMVGIRKGEAHQ